MTTRIRTPLPVVADRERRPRFPRRTTKRSGATCRRTMLRALLALLLASPALAQSGGSSPVSLVVVLGVVSLAPFLLIMLTSFVKISVVLSIVRNALGTQQIPPNQVVTGLAFVLTIFIMTPVAERVYQAAGFEGQSTGRIFSDRNLQLVIEGAQAGKEPVREFLSRHCHDRERALFVDLARRMANDPLKTVDPNGFQVLVPSFVISELKEAFQIGFIVFIPFLIIDMVVANILLALGMMMLSPTTISLPFKILLFVLVDGWFLIVQGLVLGYV